MSGIGALRHRITLQAPTKAPDGMGGTTVVWTDMCTIWAAYWPVSAREHTAAGAVQAEHTARFRIRYRFPVLSTWRLSFAGRYYAIVGKPIDVGGERRWLDILVKEAA